MHVLLLIAALWGAQAPETGTPPARAPGDYEYINCADQVGGNVLVDCAVLEIHSNGVAIHDIVEINEYTSDNPEFFVLHSAYFPLAVPKKKYEETSSWDVGKSHYTKIKQHVSNVLTGNMPVDTILIVDGSGRKLFFWYSPAGGVRAIGEQQQGVEAGEVFYCAKAKCLFQPL